MTEEEVQRVQESFRHVLLGRRLFARLFYARLFLLAPATRPLFASDADAGGERLVALLGDIVHCLDRATDLREVLQHLAWLQLAYGIAAEQYRLAGDALLRALDELIGVDFSAAQRAAWAAAYAGLSSQVVAEASELAATNAPSPGSAWRRRRGAAPPV